MKKKEINRREFLKLAATTGIGTFLIPDAVASALTQSPDRDDPQMARRTLGRTGIEVPILSMGVSQANNSNVVRAAFNSGVFYFDTAYAYQNGRSEEMLGNFFSGKPRETYCVATKAKFKYPIEDNFEEDFTGQLETSLRRLKIDYADVFFTHTVRSVGEVTDPRVIEIMKKIKAEGKARFIGLSSHVQKPELLHAAVDAGIYDVALISYNFKMNNIPETDAAIERAVKAGMGIVAMKTLTGGTEDAQGKKKINARACLKWVWQNPNITTVIPGFSNFDELEECLEAANNMMISDAEQEYLAALRNEEMLYCQQCGTCRAQCPKNLPIPDIMRAYMYAYGYKFASKSKQTLMDLNLPPEVCSGCDTCLVRCPSGFDVPRKIAAITPVTGVPDEFLA